MSWSCLYRLWRPCLLVAWLWVGGGLVGCGDESSEGAAAGADTHVEDAADGAAPELDASPDASGGDVEDASDIEPQDTAPDLPTPDLDAEPADSGQEDDASAFDDDVLIGPRQTLSGGFHVPPGQPEPSGSFSMIVASDPQLWWNFEDGQQGLSDVEVEARNQLHIDAMNALINGEHLPEGQSPPVGVIMNGDLTEYGRWLQWDAYYRLYEGVNAAIWDGLGNHDNENNNVHASNGCQVAFEDLLVWFDACDRGSGQTLWGEPACAVLEHMTNDPEAWCASDSMRRTRAWLQSHAEHLFDSDPGSAAYSWEVGDVHFIQLHNYPEYQVPETMICSAVPWLKNDLKAAFDRGKKIVLLMHKPITTSMREHLEGYQYNLVGIFYGHHHRNVGYTGDFTVGGVPIPTFYSGSVEWNVFALVWFGPDRLTVTSIDSNTGQPIHFPEVEDYTGVGGARVAAPFTWPYPTHACPPGQIPQTPDPDAPCAAPDLETPVVERCY